MDFEAIIGKHTGEDGSIPAGNVAKLAAAISSAVGREFVARDRYNAKLEEIEALKTDKQNAEDSAATAGKWEKKYNDLKSEYEAYKSDQSAKEQMNSIKAAYRKLLETSGIDPKRIDTILRATIFEGMKLDKDGNLEGAEALAKAIEKDWADFKVSTRTTGATVENPPKEAASDGANPRAAELARQFHERRYGKTSSVEGAKTE